MACCIGCVVVFFGKQKTAYEMRISDWSSDVGSSDLFVAGGIDRRAGLAELRKIGNHRQQDLHATELRCAQQRPQLDTEQFRLFQTQADCAQAERRIVRSRSSIATDRKSTRLNSSH